MSLEKTDANINNELEQTKSEKTHFNESRKIGVIGGLSIVIGNIIGSGIFITVSGTMQAAPYSLGLSLIIWLIGGLISLIGAICYIELYMYVKKSGGEKTFLSEAFGRPFGLIFLYSFTILDTPMNIAYGALTIGTYITDSVVGNCNGSDLSVKLISVLIIVVCFIINVTSLKTPIRLQILFTICKSLSLIIIIITGMVFLGKKTNISDFQKAFDMRDFDAFKLTFALTSSFWTYGGWNTLGHIAGEIKNPKKNLIISFIGGLLIIITLYILTVIAYVAVVGMEVAIVTDTIAAALGRVAFGRHLWVAPLFICLSTVGYVNGIMMTTGRIGVVAGHQGEIPYIVSLVHKTQRTPLVTLTFITILSCIFTQVNYDKLLAYSSFLAWAFYFLSMCALFYFRYYKKLENSFKVPIILPIIVQISSVYIVVMTFYDNPEGCAIMLAVVLVIFGLFFVPDRYLKHGIIIKPLGYLSYALKVGYNLETAKLSDIS